MATVLWITSFALLIMETLAGMVANGFIVLINCTDWFRSRKLSPTDLILSCLGLSRLMWQAIVMLHVIMLSFFLCIYPLSRGYVILAVMWLFTNNVTLWFAAWLSVLYLVKIATFSHPLFLQVKLRFSGMVPWLLLSSLFLSVFIVMTVTIGLNRAFAICDVYELLLNNSCDFSGHRAITGIAPTIIPSVILLSSMILLIISLWKHVRQLQYNGIGIKDPSTNVHLNAIKALASFAILYLSSFVAITVQAILVCVNDNRSWTSVFLHNVTALYPSVHAVLLISINPKLKQAWVRMVRCLKCPLRELSS